MSERETQEEQSQQGPADAGAPKDAGATADPSAQEAFAPPPDAGDQAETLDMMLDLPLEVTVELGRARMQLGEALSLQPGAIIELNRLPGEALDMYVNDRLVARGEVVVANDVLALRVAELIGGAGNSGASTGR